MKSLVFLSAAGLLVAGFLKAQEVPRFTFNIGGGFVEPVGTTGANLNTGWNVRGGAGVNLNSHVGANIDVGFADMGINSATLANIGVPGGSVHVFSATLDPIVHLNPHGHIDFYVTGGGGLFHWYQQFTQPTVEIVPGFNPFFGFYNAAVPATQVLASYSVNRPGIDIGAGVAFGALGHGKFFAEARYNHIYMTQSHVDYIPVTFGFRW
jgi:Outer membrane protein beta-barrel domain